MERLRHFSHKHTLLWYQTKDRPLWESTKCHLCRHNPDFGSVYGCTKCAFFIHWLCAKLPQHLSHPFHPQHALTLYEHDRHNSSDEMLPPCHACGITCSSYIYHCADCKFYLDDRCIKITRQPSYVITPPPKSSHPHPLLPCSVPSEEECKFSCSFCQREFFTDQIFYVCFDCKNLMHLSCSHLPRQIRHPFHIEHTLAFSCKHYAPTDFKCNACFWSEERYYIRESYTCSHCDFTLHTSCASLFPVSSDTSTSDKGHPNQPPITHTHPLVECYSSDTFHRWYCSGCNLMIMDSIFVCLNCGILLDKSCAELLPQIVHPFHPMHPLSLFGNTEKKHHFECRGCRETTHFFSYVCWKCDFHLDPRCALTRTPRMIKSAVHQHPLAFLKTKLIKSLLCNTCGGPCENHFFQCMECRFGLHLECHPELPQVIKHSCHCDPLTLRYSRIEDMIPDEDIVDKEFYCYACEEIRDPDDPTYCCQDCPFVAHLHCVMSEIVYHIETQCMPANIELSTSGEAIEGFQDNAQTNSTDVLFEKINKEKVAGVDGEYVKENIVAEDEDIISKKKAFTPNEDVVKENLTPQNYDIIHKKVTAPEEDNVEENVAAQDEGILMKKVPGSYKKIVKENITKADEDTIKDKIAAIDEEIAAIQSKIKELKENRNQFLHLERSFHRRIKHLIRKVLALNI